MSNEGASITAMSDISDRTAFNNGHRQQRETDSQTERERKKERLAELDRDGGRDGMRRGRKQTVDIDGWMKIKEKQRRELEMKTD